MTSRRQWLLGAIGAAAAWPARSVAQQQPAPALADTSNLFVNMDPTAVRPVRLPPKPGAGPSMTAPERDELEHHIKCQCGCTLDVFTCRTTDFTCQVSPAMHRDVMALVDGGYSAREILDAFVNVYGERVLMAPPTRGFNLLGYVVPSILVAIVGVLIAVLLRRWNARVAPALDDGAPAPIDATPEELARIDAAIRDDS